MSCILLLPFVSIAADADLEKDLRKSLEQSRAVVITIQNKPATSITSEIARLGTIADNIRVTSMLLEERFKLREEKAKKLGSKALERHQAMAEGYRKALTEYLSLIDNLPSDGTIPQSAIRNLQSLLQKILPQKRRPLIGSLPYKHLNYPAQEPGTAPTITPAYKGGNKTVSPDDTKSTEEAPISKELAALAQSLNWQPVLIYEYVKNTIETEWYWGCRKGAEETLRQKSGNDCDQALLFSSLLKASGFPTRIVRANIEFFAGGVDGDPMQRAKNLTGIDDPAKIAEFFQKAGIPYKPVIAGGKIVNFEISHIYVESLIPMANYRGVVIDDLGKTWLGLDTSIKTRDYVYNNAGDVSQESGVNSQLSTIRDDYLSAVQTQTPLEFLQSRINSELQTLNSQLTYSDFLRARTLPEDHLKILPYGMQFVEKTITGEYTELPDELRHKVRFVAKNTLNSELFNIELDTFRLSNQQIAVSYEPETVQDQEIIDSYGGLDNTPAYLVHLRPMLKVNGERIVVATDGLPMGTDYNLTIELLSPSVNGGATPAETITNNLVAGNLSVIGITAGKAALTPSPLAGEGGGEGEKDAERLLYESAQHYIDRWNKAEDELASLFHLILARPLPTVVTVGGVIDVDYLLDMPHGFTWKGVFIDADVRRIEAVQSSEFGVQSERQKLFMQLSSLQGSVLENRIFEDDFKVESISTAKMIQVSNQQSAVSSQLFTIDKANISTILPTLSLDDNVKDDITNAVNQNMVVRLPSADSLPLTAVSYENWTGIGYIKENPATGESGWMLSGMIAGGMTATAEWLNNLYLQQTLSMPYTGPTNADPLSAARILKIPATDKQPPQTVGKPLAQPLSAAVLDNRDQSVKGASVTFSIIAGGGKIQCLDASGSPVGQPAETPCEAKTDTRGIARAKLTPGKETGDNPDYMKLDPADEQYTQIGMNLVAASVKSYSGNIPLAQPFEAYGKPDVPIKIDKTFGDGTASIVNTPAGSLTAVVRDQYGNPVSNVKLLFGAKPPEPATPTSAFPTPAQGLRNIVLYKKDECAVSYPLYGDCPTHESLTLATGVYGVMVNTILGNTVDTRYTVEVTAQNLPIGSNLPVVQPVVFTLYSTGRRDGDIYIPTTVLVRHLELVNDQGRPSNASKAGTLLKAPLVSRLVKITDTLIMKPSNCSWGGNCWRTASNGIITIEPVPNGNVTYTAKEGNGVAGPTENIQNGLYRAPYTTGPVPLKNIVEASGEAPIEVPEILYNPQTGQVQTNDYQTDTLPLRSVTAPSGAYPLFDKNTLALTTPVKSANPTYTVYGVNAGLAVTPKLVQISKEGYTLSDTTFNYTILPDGAGSTDITAAYRANSADIDFFRTDQNNAETWDGYMLGDTLQGQGTEVLTAGTPFDVANKYAAQVVLNRGNDAEVRGNKIPVKIASFLIVKPTMDGKILIKNDSNGDPKMPTLKAQVELKGSGLSPSELDLTGKNICWQFKVEYKVNITKSGAEYRSRDGLECNDQGVCEGEDGYFIPALDPDTNIPGYKCLTGPTFTIDETGNNGAKWDDSNFGGGTLSIIAKTDIGGIPVSDTYASVIQGQKNGDDSADELVDTKFKEKVCKYLEAPAGVQNYQTEILDVLGHNKVFRVISYHESAHTYAHFERLNDGFWKSLGPILGYSSDNVYPLVNKGCVMIDMPDGTKKCDQSQPFWSDGGFGLMQLTDPAPSYLQVWNWKENVNSGVNLVKIKLNQAKTYLNAHTPLNDSIGKTILRMETYHRYGPSYKKDKKTITYWKWDKDNGWVFSTEDWLYADILRNIEDAVDDGSFSQLPGWKYNGE